MARLMLCVLALLATEILSDPTKETLRVPADRNLLEHQLHILELFYHAHEPNYNKEFHEIEHSWDIEKHADLYNNATAVEWSVKLLNNDWILPRTFPLSLYNRNHLFHVTTFFNLLYSAKTYEAFFNTAVYLRSRINEYLYVYTLSVAIYHRHDTQGLIVPPLYSIFPSFFHNSEIMNTAHRINTHGKHWVDYYPSTYVWEDNVVIKANETIWPYITDNMPVAYFTHDPAVSELYYTLNLFYPRWLGQPTSSLVKDRRGELVWWIHRQYLTRYYMERLSNGLGEIPELDWHVVEEGYNPGLRHWSGISFPSRPDHFHLDSPWIIEKLQEIEEYESRIREAIDKGFVITNSGEHLSIRNPDAIDILGRMIDANADSPNIHYYKDFINIWKQVLGNSRIQEQTVLYNNIMPLVMPSVLESDEISVRDSAFYMIWKRVFRLFNLWHEQLPEYTHKQLTVPSVSIEKVDVDKLVTYFENIRYNVTNDLWMDKFESEQGWDRQSVLVERSQLNHKVYTTRVHVKSEEEKQVTVRFFLAPKYDSKGQEIPLHLNSHNFFQLDVFNYVLTKGENVITRSSNDVHAPWAINDLYDGHELYQKVEAALHGHGQYFLDVTRRPGSPTKRILLPKGRVGGMPFIFMIFISEYQAPNVVYGTGFDAVSSPGLGSGARRISNEPYGFPLDRPLHLWQVADIKNIWFEDVKIYHKNTPEVPVSHEH